MKTESLKISIVTPCFNSKDYLEKCILSVLGQTYAYIEYIVVDGGSSDGTVDILKRYADRIKYISEKDRGNYDAIRKGFEMASGDVLTWIDSDNYYYSNDVIEKIASRFNDESPDIVVTDCFSHHQGSERLRPVRPSLSQLNFNSLLRSGSIFMPECAFYTKESYIKAGKIGSEPKVIFDYELFLNIFKQNPKVSKLNIFSAVYEVRANAILRKQFFKAWRETFDIGRIYNRPLSARVKIRMLYAKAIIRFYIVSIIKKDSRLSQWMIKTFK